MEQQQHGFSDSMLRAGSDRLQKSARSLLSALQLQLQCPIVKSMGHVISTLFKSQEKIRPIGVRLRDHSDQSKDVLRILKLYCCLFQEN